MVKPTCFSRNLPPMRRNDPWAPSCELKKEKKDSVTHHTLHFQSSFQCRQYLIEKKKNTQNISAHQAVASLIFVFQGRINKLVHIRKRNQWVQQLVCHKSHLESCLFCQGNEMLVILWCNIWELWECLVIWHFVIFYPNIPRLIMSHNYTVSAAPQSFDPLISPRYIFLLFFCRWFTDSKHLLQYSINHGVWDLLQFPPFPCEVRFNIISRNLLPPSALLPAEGRENKLSGFRECLIPQLKSSSEDWRHEMLQTKSPKCSQRHMLSCYWSNAEKPPSMQCRESK